MKGAWSVWSITWLSLVAVSLGSVLVLVALTGSSVTDALVQGLEDHVRAEAGLVATAAAELPVETVARIGGARSRAEIDARLEALREGGHLHDLALIGPDVVLGSGGTWLPGAAERDLIARAVAGEVVAGPLYTAADGEPYLTAYAPVPGHPGWVAAVEGSGATLRAADRLRRTQLLVSGVLLVLVTAGAALVALLLSAPLVRLERALGAGEAVPVEGPREVRHVAQTLDGLLGGIRERDARIAAEHDARIAELTRLAAGVAHELRNPLNAMSLTVRRLERLSGDEQTAAMSGRLLDQVGQLEVIVQRLVDLTAPLAPAAETLDLRALLGSLAGEVPLGIDIDGDGVLVGDRGMVLQILRNLLLNAHQAGATRVHVAIDAGPALVASFTDDGPGIAEPDAAFEWFHTTRAQGSGLGLPLSRRLAEAMQGSLTLASAHPTTFQLRMPTP